LGLSRTDVGSGLAMLEAEGFVMRGHFSPQLRGRAGADHEEWCERRLLARIHRYTLNSLRAQIEPVSSGDFMRYLLEWQGVTREPRAQGSASLAAIIEQLEGFALPAAAWEADVLPVRMGDYEPGWLDALCLSGRALWARLDAAGGNAGPVRGTPIALVTRAHLPLWQRLMPPASELALSAGALAMEQLLRSHGASFFEELAAGSGLLASQAEGALAELVAAGRVTADSFAGLRALLLPMQRRRKLAARSCNGSFGLAEAGRWSLLARRPRQSADSELTAEELESVAWLLLRRYGVVFRRLLSREASWLPPWHALLRSYRRLEAQGHIRAGRFVAGATGEQYALPEAVSALRSVRRREAQGTLVTLSAADPLNLTGVVTPGARIAALAGNRLLLRDGVAVATHIGGEVQWLEELPAAQQWQARMLLVRPARTAARRSA
jgi:ATP-dependent Lhr-like helicase